MSGPRTFFGDIGFFVFFGFFGFPRVFLVFGSGSFCRLLRLPKTQKPWKKTPTKKGLSGMCGPRALFRSIVLCGCLVLLKFWLFVFSHALCRLAPTNFSHTSTLMTFHVYRLRVSAVVLRRVTLGIARRLAFQNLMLSQTQNLWLHPFMPFKKNSSYASMS